MGIRRSDGRIATRNYIGILTSVNCSATVARMIAEHFKNRLDDYPNVDGLGCEANQINMLLSAQGLKKSDKLGAFTIQEKGGTRKAVEHGIARVKEMLPEANKVQREPLPASHLILGLQCGGSDGYSGISANPALGAAVDLLVRHGGTAIL